MINFFLKNKRLREIQNYTFDTKAWNHAMNVIASYLTCSINEEMSQRFQQECRAYFTVCVLEPERQIVNPSALLSVVISEYTRFDDVKESLKRMGLASYVLKRVSSVNEVLRHGGLRVTVPGYVHSLAALHVHCPNSEIEHLDTWINPNAIPNVNVLTPMNMKLEKSSGEDVTSSKSPSYSKEHTDDSDYVSPTSPYSYD